MIGFPFQLQFTTINQRGLEKSINKRIKKTTSL